MYYKFELNWSLNIKSEELLKIFRNFSKHSWIIAIASIVTFLLVGDFVIGHFVNDIHQLQANALSNGEYSLGLDVSKFIFLDTTYFNGKLYISWGLIPGIIYMCLDAIYPFGLFPKNIVYIAHLCILLFSLSHLIKVSVKNHRQQFLLMAFITSTPFISYYYSGDVSSLKITSLYSLSYFLAAACCFLYRKNHYAQSLLLLCVLTKFSYLPFVIILTTFFSFKNQQRKNIFWLVVYVGALLIVNYLKFQDIFFWGERYNKFQGEWFTIFKTLQLGAHGPINYLWSVIDGLKGLFINSEERFFQQSLTISQVNSKLLYPTFIGLFILLYNKFKSKFSIVNVYLITFLASLSFQILFQRFYSLRTLDLTILMLFFMCLELKMSKKFYILLWSCVFVNIYFIDFSRSNVVKQYSLELDDDLVRGVDLNNRSSYSCNEVFKSFSSRQRDLILPGLNADCSFHNAVSFILSYKKNVNSSCRVVVSAANMNCENFYIRTRLRQVQGMGARGECQFDFVDIDQHDFYYLINTKRSLMNWSQKVSYMKEVRLDCGDPLSGDSLP